MAINLDISAKQDIICRRGDTFKQQFAFTANSVAMDLTGIVIRMHVKNFSTILLSFAIGSGITVANPANGIIQLNKSATEMAALKPAKYKYDLEFTYPSGDRLTIMQGEFTVNEDYTI